MSLLKSIIVSALLANESMLALARPRNRWDVNGKPRQLVLNENQKFKIMQITDLHLGENRENDVSTIMMIKMIQEKEDVDFIAVTGDLVSGQMDEHEDNMDYWSYHIRGLEKQFESIEVPWGFVPGYHDYEAD
jgi:predicted MPP superfamily phosphohydrolase